MELEAFVQEVAGTLLLRGVRLGLCKQKGWKKQTPEQPQANGDTPPSLIIDLCMSPVTHNHDGRGRFAPPFIPVLSPSSFSQRQSGTQFSSLVQEKAGLKCHLRHSMGGLGGGFACCKAGEPGLAWEGSPA